MTWISYLDSWLHNFGKVQIAFLEREAEELTKYVTGHPHGAYLPEAKTTAQAEKLSLHTAIA